MSGMPTHDDIETALSVLLWLHEDSTDGRARDEISHVRYMLDELDEAAP
jgi:hypothetical protein